MMSLWGVVSHVDGWRRSACFEGAWRAYACVKTHWHKVDTMIVATGPHTDKPCTVEQFYQEVEEGAWLTETTCPKDTLYY